MGGAAAERELKRRLSVATGMRQSGRRVVESEKGEVKGERQIRYGW